MRTIGQQVGVLAVLITSSLAGAQSTRTAVTLRVGDAAPALRLGAMVRGAAVARFEPGTVYVLEFWSTTCGPCRPAAAKVSELQRQFPAVVVVGVDVRDEDADVAPFVAKMGERMAYRVALDDKREQPRGAMLASWMDAAGERGVPCTFVVDAAARIAWIGHPNDVEPVLAKVVDGTYDIAAAKALSVRIQSLFERAADCRRRNDLDGVAATLAEIERADATRRRDAAFARFNLLLDTTRAADAIAAGERIVDGAADETESLSLQWLAMQVLWLDKPSAESIAFGHRAIRRSLELRDYATAQLHDTEARLFAREGKWDAAINAAKRALAASGDDRERDEYDQTLRQLERRELPIAYPR